MTNISLHDAGPRRPYWIIGFIAPMLAPMLFGLHALGLPIWAVAAAPLAQLFGAAPIVDHLVGRDYRNVTPEVARALEADPYSRRLMHGIVPSYAEPCPETSPTLKTLINLYFNTIRAGVRDVATVLFVEVDLRTF